MQMRPHPARPRGVRGHSALPRRRAALHTETGRRGGQLATGSSPPPAGRRGGRHNAPAWTTPTGALRAAPSVFPHADFFDSSCTVFLRKDICSFEVNTYIPGFRLIVQTSSGGRVSYVLKAPRTPGLSRGAGWRVRARGSAEARASCG